MNKKTWWIIVAVVIVLVGGYIATRGGDNGGTVVSEEGPIKIGAIQALTGDVAVLGVPQSEAIQLAIDEANQAGGINGRMLELVSEDGKCDPQGGGTAGQKLVSVDKVAVILGGTCSGETLAAAAVSEPAHVVLISTSASSPKVSEAGDFVFRTYPSDALAGKVAATYAHDELKATKAAVISELTDYAQGLREVYKTTFSGLGGTIVADETYATGDTDFRTQVLKIKQANPDVVYVVPQSQTPGVAIFKQLRDNGVTAKFTTAEVLMDDTTVKENATALAGVIGVRAGVDYENNEQAKAFQAAFRAKYNKEPGAFAGFAYDAARLAIAAIRDNDGKVDTAKIRDYLYSVKDWEGAVGSLTMDSNGDPQLGLNVVQVVAGAVKNLVVGY